MELDPGARWWRSIHVTLMVLAIAAVGPALVYMRAAQQQTEADARRAHELSLARMRDQQALHGRYLDTQAPRERQRVLRSLSALSNDDMRAWAKRELEVVSEDVVRADELKARQDALQMEAFNLAAKALNKDPAALAEHYRTLGYAIADGRVASSGTFESISGVAAPSRLSDLLHKLIDDKRVCVASGKDDAACGEQVGVTGEPTAADFAAMRDLEEKADDADAKRRLSDLRKQFLKQ